METSFIKTELAKQEEHIIETLFSSIVKRKDFILILQQQIFDALNCGDSFEVSKLYTSMYSSKGSLSLMEKELKKLSGKTFSQIKKEKEKELENW